MYFNLICLQIEGLIGQFDWISSVVFLGLFIGTILVLYYDYGEETMGIGVLSIVAALVFITWSHFTAPAGENVRKVAKAKGVDVSDITVIVLDRPRHADLLKELRKAGARIRLIKDGDVAAAIETTRLGTGIDILMGIGGTPEGVVTAAAMRALGGVIQGQLVPQSESEKASAKDAGHDLSKIYMTNDLVASDDVFFSATGITDGELLRGVRHTAFGAISHSLVVRGHSKTIRIIETEHRYN